MFTKRPNKYHNAINHELANKQAQMIQCQTYPAKCSTGFACIQIHILNVEVWQYAQQCAQTVPPAIVQKLEKYESS